MDYLERLEIRKKEIAEKEKEKIQADIVKAIAEQTKVLEQVRDILQLNKE